MHVDITELAEAELESAVTWYKAQTPGMEQAFLNEFRAAVGRICSQPLLYQEIETGIRRGLMNRFPYSVVYEYDTYTLRILAVAHQHRYPQYWVNQAR